MSERYTLKQISASAWSILSGGRKVGHAAKVPAGYVARIGQHCEIGITVREAFDRTAAKALGFATPAALAAQNAQVRQHNAAIRQAEAPMRQAIRGAIDEAANGNSKPFIDMLDKVFAR
jgi:hypothetical protein